MNESPQLNGQGINPLDFVTARYIKSVVMCKQKQVKSRRDIKKTEESSSPKLSVDKSHM